MRSLPATLQGPPIWARTHPFFRWRHIASTPLSARGSRRRREIRPQSRRYEVAVHPETNRDIFWAICQAG
jgi:hypothetical protein